jgi:hypothetical protein
MIYQGMCLYHRMVFSVSCTGPVVMHICSACQEYVPFAAIVLSGQGVFLFDRLAPRKPRPSGRGKGELYKNVYLPYREAPPFRAERLQSGQFPPPLVGGIMHGIL